MSPAELLSWLRSQGVSLSAWGSRLKYAGPEEVLTEEPRAALRAAKDALLELLALEMLPSYGLAGFLKGRRQSSEAALKYVVFGGAASGVMLYGISLLQVAYGSAGAFFLGSARLYHATGLISVGLTVTRMLPLILGPTLASIFRASFGMKMPMEQPRSLSRLITVGPAGFVPVQF